jgi:zinc transporter ZupT
VEDDPKTAGADERAEFKRFSEHHYGRAQTLAAWLLATLVAVNSGAGLSLLSAARPPNESLAQPVLAFVAGVVCAILSGLASWQAAFDQAGTNFLKSKATRTSAQDNELRKWGKRGTNLEKGSRLLNAASLLCFVGGCAWAAFILHG